jgi:hypothetical protein
MEFVKYDSVHENLVTRWQQRHNVTGPLEAHTLALIVAAFFDSLKSGKGMFWPDQRAAVLEKVASLDHWMVGFKLRMIDILSRHEKDLATKLAHFIGLLHNFSKVKLKLIFLHRDSFWKTLSTFDAQSSSIYHPEKLERDQLEQYLHRTISIRPKSFISKYMNDCVLNILTLRQLHSVSANHSNIAEFIDIKSEQLARPESRKKTIRDVLSFLLQRDGAPSSSSSWGNLTFEETFEKFLPTIHSPPNLHGRSALPLSARIQNSDVFLRESLKHLLRIAKKPVIESLFPTESIVCQGELKLAITEEMKKLYPEVQR